MIVDQRVRNELHVLQIGKKIKQRITRCRHQHLIARIAQQAKDERVGFAGAGGENNPLWTHRKAIVLAIVRGYSPSGTEQALSDGLIAKTVLVLERRQDGTFVVGETDGSWI